MTSAILKNRKMNEKIERWEKKEGVEFLRKVGVRKNQIVLDFGCGVGHYTIPATGIVGSTGFVYAVDKEQQALKELQKKVKAHNLKNVRIIKASGQIESDFESESIDVVLFYDVLHYLGKDERKKLYGEAFRVLKQSGLLSVYPKHTAEDDPIMEFQNLHLSDVRQEIKSSGFQFDRKYYGIISHDDGLNKGCVLNFRKGKNENNNSL